MHQTTGKESLNPSRARVSISQGMKQHLLLFPALVLVSTHAFSAPDSGDQVVVVYNTKVPESKQVAEH